MTTLFLSGLIHPWIGMDHLCAALGVGLWSTQQRGGRVWLLPLVFVSAMSFGIGLGWAGFPLPAVEAVILGSVIVIGALIALSVRLSTIGAVTLLAGFALLHGHAHGTELPRSLELSAGIVTGTAALHALGVGSGLALRRKAELVRYAGAGIALAGLFLSL